MTKISIKKILANEWFLVIVFYFLFTFLITFPLIFNMNGFLLPQEYSDISHSDSIQHTSKIDKARTLISEGESPVIVDKTDVGPIYIFSGLLLTGLGLSSIAFHNLFLMFVLFFAGFFMYLLTKELTKNKVVSFFAGFLYMSSQYILYAYYWGHSNTVQIQWIPFIFLFLERFIRYRKTEDALLLGVGLGLQIMSGSYHVAHLGFAIPIYVILRFLLVEKKFVADKKFWLKLIFAAVTAFIISGFYLIKKLMVSHSVIRTLEENMQSYWRLNSLVDVLNIQSFLYIGLIQFALLILAIYFIFRNLKDYRKYLPFLILLIFVLISMMGPFSIFAPGYWLYKAWPLFNHLRVPFRMFPLFLLPLSLLCTIPLQKIKKKYQIIAVVVVILIIFLTNLLYSPWLSNLHMYFL